MSLRSTLLAAAVLAAPAVAVAQPVSGPYIALGAGYNILQSSSFDGGRQSYDGGWAGLGSFGWGFGNGLRLELEGFYRTNDTDAVRFDGRGKFADAGGGLDQWGVMANVLFDLDIGVDWMSPYVGAGVGWSWMDGSGSVNTGAFTRWYDGTDNQFAYQGIVGLSFPIAPLPGLAITAEYRYFATLDPEFAGVELQNRNHSFLIGARYAFNHPAPAVVAPPAEVSIARSYLVFFDWDRANLNDRARQIISEAAAASRQAAVTTIEVSGHADRSGSAAYNQRLSLRRAQNVAAELVQQGVPQTAITIQAFGETRPLVPTPDGVREPQNRRVEIVLK